jgi:hypothetical protein
MNYTEALKCFLCALRIDKDNLQILRDTALLQVGMGVGVGVCRRERGGRSRPCSRSRSSRKRHLGSKLLQQQQEAAPGQQGAAAAIAGDGLTS